LGPCVDEQLQGRLDGLEIFSGEQHDVVAAVAGDVDALMRASDLVSDLGESGLRLRQREAGLMCRRFAHVPARDHASLGSASRQT
jgi:hypothetical protein